MLEEDGSSEVRQLIQAFNAMQHRIHALIEDRTHALAAVGHDLRTPLSRVQLRAENIDDPALRAAIARDVSEMEAMLASLLAFLGGEDDPETAVPTDLAVMAATIVDDVCDRGGDARYSGRIMPRSASGRWASSARSATSSTMRSIMAARLP